jgi:FkbM family methyltransferase
VVLDAGGCWGDTALWFAHAVAPGGMVHTFEPTPGNRRVLDQNLSLNPVLAQRIRVWSDPLGPESGLEVWMPDVIAAGAAVQAQAQAVGEFESSPMRTQAVDDLVAIPDFLAGLGGDYRWYLQCSTMTDVDTVAFAVPVE